MFYLIKHSTYFRYPEPVRESIMEVRMHPRSEGFQRCLSFELAVDPRTHVLGYRDAEGNSVHHFNIPGAHSELSIVAESVVEMQTPPSIPDRLDDAAWDALDEEVAQGDFLDYLLPSHFAHPTPLLREVIQEFGFNRADGDPLSLLQHAKSQMTEKFSYVPASTRVDSSIDEALSERRGVCQDFTHIMIAMARELGIPARYCSGYFQHNRTEQAGANPGATHAWVEAYLPGYGWVGLDFTPSNTLIAGVRHIRTAIGRDYADVPPTRGRYEGRRAIALDVAVTVTPTQAPRLERMPSPSVSWSSAVGTARSAPYSSHDTVPFYEQKVQSQARYQEAPQQQQQG